MAKLNLNKKKLINEDNLRAIISYGLGFASRVKTLEDKEIAPFEANKMYLKDSLCIYNDYIYMAKVTNQSATFNENYWTLLGDDITELSKTDIETMLGLTTEEIETLSKIILDTEVRLDKTWSSSKIYTDIQDAIDTSKTYTLAELGKISGASYKIANSTSDMTDEKVIYLLQNGSTYDMYIVDGGTPTRIGDTTIDLSDYYTKTEIDNDFLKKTDATSTYATKTELDDKVDKTNILSATSSTATDDNLYSAKLLNGELDKKANVDDVNNKIDKTSISTTIDSTVTNEQVASAKAVYDNIKYKYLPTLHNTDVLDYIVNNINKEGFYTFYVADDCTNTPRGNWTRMFVDYLSKTRIIVTGVDIRSVNNTYEYKNTMIDKWSGWQRVCTTSVSDVGKTALKTLSGARFTETSGSDRSYYIVKNGFCFVSIDITTVNPVANTWYELYKLPKPAYKILNIIPNFSDTSTIATGEPVYTQMNTDGSLTIRYNESTSGKRFIGTFSYPVAES